MVQAVDRAAASLAGSQPQDVAVLLRCKTDHTRLITKMLGAVCLKEHKSAASVLNGPIAWCQVSPSGLRFTTEESHDVQARVYLQKDLFREYEYAETDAYSFALNLGATMECLRILDGRGAALAQPPSLHVRFSDETGALSLTLIEGLAVTECEIATMDHGEPSERGGAAVAQACRIVLRADVLREALAELEWGDANHRDKAVALAVSGAQRELCLTVRNTDSGCEVRLPAESLSKVEIPPDQAVAETYKYSHLQAIARALGSAEEACLRVLDGGELNVMMRLAEGGKTGYVEYYITPLATDGADDDDYDAGRGFG